MFGIIYTGVAIIIAIVMISVLAILFYRGNKVMKLRDKTIKKIGEDEREPIEQLAYVSYHGGFPEIPKPQKLTIAMADNYLLLYTNKGQMEKSYFNQWEKIDHFTTAKKTDPKKISMIWGPFTYLLASRERKRHFIVIQYKDRDKEKNHILIEHDNIELLNGIFEKLKAQWKKKASL